MAKLTEPRYRQTSTLLPNGRVLIIAGQNDTYDMLTTELYNLATGVFTATGNLATPRASHTATSPIAGRFLRPSWDRTHRACN
ncbi:MAG: hypothetical protein ACR2II_03980 [Chthoniobacterales bacterium]